MRQPSLHPGLWAGPTGRTTESAPGINSIACGGHLGQAASVRGQSNQVLSEVLRAGRASTAGLSPLSTPDSILICFVSAHVCYAYPSSCHAGVCHVAEGFCATEAGLPAASRLPTGRMRMDDIEFHGEPPSNIPTMVVAFGGWVDAGDAATGALRSLVRQLAATPLATIDPEAFVDFTTIRPVVRVNAAGE